MAKARAIVKRRKSVRNIRKITKTMQMIATAKFQKALKRAVGGKPFTTKAHEIVDDLVRNVENYQNPLMARNGDLMPVRKVAIIVISSNRGLAGAYNGSVLRKAGSVMRDMEQQGNEVQLYVAGKKAASFFTFQKRPIAGRLDQFVDQPKFNEIRVVADRAMQQYIDGAVDAVYVVYTNFVSAGVQRPGVIRLLPLDGAAAASQHLVTELSQTEAAAQRVGDKPAAAVQIAQQEARLAHMGRGGSAAAAAPHLVSTTTYDFSPSAKELLDELLPMTVRLTLYQCFLDATTSENVARMVAMKSASDNADKMIKLLTMQYNRARQSQITTELSEIMGGVEAMKK